MTKFVLNYSLPLNNQKTKAMNDMIPRLIFHAKPRTGSPYVRFDAWDITSAHSRWMRFFYKVLPLLAIAFMVLGTGCSRKDEDAPRFKGDFCELVPRQEKFEKGEEKTVDELKDDDVLVAVNGYPLTKKVFDDLMLIKAKELSQQKGANGAYLSNQLADFKKRYINYFVDHRLLIDKARELKVLAQDELEKKVNEVVKGRAKGKKMTVEKYLRTFPGDFKYFLYETAEIILIESLVKKHIPPVAIVDEGFVAAFKQSIADDNVAFTKTNGMKRVQMLQWKTDIQEKKVTFEELAKKYNEDEDADDAKPGYWGMFERGDFDDKRVQSAVFALKVGEISDPVEDDDGFHLIKVLSVKPPVRNEKGRIIQDETRTVSHIYVKKMPLFIEETDVALTADLKRQMQVQAVDRYVNDIKTNGVTRIEYPNGKNLFR